MVGETGLEPAPVLPDNDLNVARIPIPPLARANKIIPKIYQSAVIFVASITLDSAYPQPILPVAITCFPSSSSDPIVI